MWKKDHVGMDNQRHAFPVSKRRPNIIASAPLGQNETPSSGDWRSEKLSTKTEHDLLGKSVLKKGVMGTLSKIKRDQTTINMKRNFNVLLEIFLSRFLCT